jgi:hypothetical protein
MKEEERLKIKGRLPRRGLTAALGSCIAVLAMAGTAQAGTLTLGPTLSAPAIGSSSCAIACGIATTKLGESSTASPVAGTIVRWRLDGATETEGFVLNVVRRNSGGTFTVTASSGPVTPQGAEIETFTTNLPIAAGEFIELNFPEGGAIALLETPSTEAFFRPGLAPGETREPEDEEEIPSTNGYNADVEYGQAPVVPAPVVIPPPPAPVAHCVVPKLKGKKLKAAKKMLRAADCRVGKVKKLQGASAKTGKVVKQKPKPGKVLAPGSRVSVKLGA